MAANQNGHPIKMATGSMAANPAAIKMDQSKWFANQNCLQKILAPCKFAPMQIHPMQICPMVKFAPWQIRSHANSPHVNSPMQCGI